MIVLQHSMAAPGYVLPSLTWDYWLWGTDEIHTAIIGCGNGHTGTLSPKIHTIAADGAVSPSCVCTYKGCSWHEFARLEGWELRAAGLP